MRRIAGELAEAAGLTTAEAQRVLDVLHVKQLVTNANTVSEAHAQERLAVSSADAFTLDNLRIGFKSKAISSIIV